MAGAISPRALQALIALGGAAVLALWWHSTLALNGLGGWLPARARSSACWPATALSCSCC